MKNILITGASGFLGKKLIKLIWERKNYRVFALARNQEEISVLTAFHNDNPSDKLEIISAERYFSSKSEYHFDYVVHMAFARLSMGNKEIANSVVYSRKVFKACRDNEVKSILFISSQGVYGDEPEIRKLDTPVQPNTTYSMAKYVVEQLLEEICNGTGIIFSSMRLDNVAQSQNLPKGLCRAAKYEKRINLVGGQQIFSYIDVDDAVSAMFSLIQTDTDNWKSIYNVGIDNQRLTLMDMANIVADECVARGMQRPEISLEPKDISIWAGMDTKVFLRDTGWEPKRDIKAMISAIFETV